MGPVAIDPMVRFWRHVQPEAECLVWTSTYAGSKSRHGTFRPGTCMDGPKAYAHRWIWEQINGPIPPGMELDHVRARGCRGPGCVNVAHLEVVTSEENSRRARLDTCRAGKHDLSIPVNVRWDEQGRRRGCAACRREYEQTRCRVNGGENR